MKKYTVSYSLEALDTAAQELYYFMPRYSVFTFSGPLGAGKTTLVQALLKKCGIYDIVPSPTFTYFTQYTNQQDQTFYHFDLYRLKNREEFSALGFEEYLFLPSSWVFIEWPEIIFPLLIKNCCHCSINYISTDTRELLYTLV